MLLHHHLRRAVRVACPSIVPEATPLGQDGIQRRTGQILPARKGAEETPIIRQGSAHLGLLQEDLGQPQGIVVPGLSPRQLVPAMVAIPGQQQLREPEPLLCQRQGAGLWRLLSAPQGRISITTPRAV